MLGWPTTDWGDDPAPFAPIDAVWTTLNETARHTFTHFHLILTVQIAQLPQNAAPTRGHFSAVDTFDHTALPTVMQKAYTIANATLRTV